VHKSCKRQPARAYTGCTARRKGEGLEDTKSATGALEITTLRSVNLKRASATIVEGRGISQERVMKSKFRKYSMWSLQTQEELTNTPFILCDNFKTKEGGM